MSPEKFAAIRRAVADYMRSEGCGCCSDRAAHEADTERLAMLLRVPMYDDKSGYDFGRYETGRSVTPQTPKSVS